MACSPAQPDEIGRLLATAPAVKPLNRLRRFNLPGVGEREFLFSCIHLFFTVLPAWQVISFMDPKILRLTPV
jgi:hypothetical protein